MSVSLNPIPKYLIEEMEGDNGCCFHPTKRQIDQLNIACSKLNKDITLNELEILSSGEHSDQLNLIERYPETGRISELLNEVFENIDDGVLE